MKKLILPSVVLALASTGIAFANGGSYMPEPQMNGHFYVGAGISRDTAHLRYESGAARDDQSMSGVGGRLFAGYGMTFQDRYYLGIEPFVSITSNQGRADSVDITGAVTEGKYTQRYTYGISLIPGFKLSDSTMMYGNVGYVRSRFRLESAGVDIFKKSTNGLRLGLGMETMVANNVSVRGGWNWNYYSKITENLGGDSIRPITDDFYLDLIYHFV